LQIGVRVKSLANPDRDVDSLSDQVNTTIGDDKMELQQWMRGKEARHRGCKRRLEPERATQSNEPTRLCLYPEGSLLGRFGFEYGRACVLENLLTDLRQTKSSRRSIKQAHAQALLKQRDASAQS
jgi:hypothetical protein